MRTEVRRIFEAGVAAADPEAAVMRALAVLEAPTHIFALGKAAMAMTRAARAHSPEAPGLVVTTQDTAQPLPGIRLYVGDHPVPTERSLAAGEAALDWLGQIGRSEGARAHVLALISGGGSALCVAPVKGVSLAEKARVNSLLLASGLDIVQMNIVRQALSRTKGGGLRAAAAPARMTSLVLSDVVGDDPCAVASGPTAGPISTLAEAARILQGADLWAQCPPSVRDALSRPEPPRPSQAPDVRMIGSNRISVAAMAEAAASGKAGPVTRRDAPLEGDVAEAAEVVAGLARSGAGLWLMGGETTVRLRGTGQGGRNQELALRVARELQDLGRPFVFLSGGTDGRDGPTDAAGGCVDEGTWARIGPDAAALLDNNDSYAALDRAGDLIRMPATGTNVADLQVLWVGDR